MCQDSWTASLRRVALATMTMSSARLQSRECLCTHQSHVSPCGAGPSRVVHYLIDTVFVGLPEAAVLGVVAVACSGNATHVPELHGCISLHQQLPSLWSGTHCLCGWQSFVIPAWSVLDGCVGLNTEYQQPSIALISSSGSCKMTYAVSVAGNPSSYLHGVN